MSAYWCQKFKYRGIYTEKKIFKKWLKQNEHGSRYTLHEMSVFFRFIAKNQLKVERGVVTWRDERSRYNLFRHDGEDDILVSSPNHQAEGVVFFDGGADVTGWRDSLAVNADDDVVFLQTSATRWQMNVLAIFLRFS